MIIALVVVVSLLFAVSMWHGVQITVLRDDVEKLRRPTLPRNEPPVRWGK